MEKEIGKVNHWYDKINVAVVELSGALSVGADIVVKKGEETHPDKVLSMQLDHKDITSGKKGQEVAIKISGVAKDGALICKTA